MFLFEGKKYSAQLEQAFNSIEKDASDKRIINEIFRIMHSFKGMAGTANFKKFESYFHDYETMMSMIRDDQLIIESEIIDFFFESLDIIERSLTSIENKQSYENLIKSSQEWILNKTSNIGLSESEVEQKKEKIQHLFSKYGLKPFNPDRTISNNISISVFHIVLSSNTVLKLARILIIVKKIQKFGEIIASVPIANTILGENPPESFSFYVESQKDSDKIREEIQDIMDVEEVRIQNLSKSQFTLEMTQFQSKEAKLTPTQKAVIQIPKIQSIEIDLTTIDTLYTQFMELFIRSRQLEKRIDQEQELETKELLFQMHSYMQNLQEIVLKLQLVPISKILRIFPRMVRNIAKKQNKEINLTITHHDIKIEQTILNKLGNIINHILRNAIDHGIESMDTRLERGKQVSGTIQIDTKIVNNVFILTISDDGKGMDIQKIGQKAIGLGMHTSDEIATMSKPDLIDLIFSPNFSTSETISNISGRGMGMNIVKDAIQSLNGTIQIETELNKGTDFIIKIPLSKSIISVLLIQRLNQTFSIPFEFVQEIFEIPSKLIVYERDLKYVNLNSRGSLSYSSQKFDPSSNNLQIYDIIDFIPQLKRKNIPMAENIKIVHIIKNTIQFGLIVDDFKGESEVIVRDLNLDEKPDIKGISGAAILNDGTVSLIVDPLKLIQ